MNISVSSKTGRNDPCPCGSGRKYKACCSQVEEKFKTRQVPDIPRLLMQARQAAAFGQIEQAEFYFRQILAVQPRHAEALAGLGQKLCWERKRREGLGYLRQAAKQLEKDVSKSRDIRQALELCGQLQHWGDLDAAIRLAQLAAKLVPQSAVAQYQLAQCLSRVNRVAEALLPAQKACLLLPDDPGCNILLAVLNSRQGQLQKARDQLKSVIEKNLDAEQTARAWLELGTVLDRLGDYDSAFGAFQHAASGHSALPAAQSVDSAYIFQWIARNRAGFDRELLNRWSPAELQDGLPTPAFLFGFLRSGTTLTEQVLGAHPGVFASDETNFIFELAGDLERLSGVAGDVPAGLRRVGVDGIRMLRRIYWERVQREYGDIVLRKRFVDKLALNSIDAGFIATLFPEAKIVFALRDPRDVCLSCFSQPFGFAPATVNLLSWEGIAREYAAVMDLWLQLRGSIQTPYLELRYEDAVNDFEITYRQVFELLDVEWRPEVMAFHQSAKGRYISTPSFAAVSQPLYKTAVARWKRYEGHFQPILPQLARFVEAFGYAEAP